MAIGKQSVGSIKNLFQGYWSHVEFRPGGFDETATARYLGVVQEGVLEISREDTEYMGTTFPRVVEVLTPSQMGMKFSGQLDELHYCNMLIAMGDDAKVASATTGTSPNPDPIGGYIYPGASCQFSENEFGTLIARRKRCSDGFVMEACIWKTLGSGGLSLGGDADVVGTTVEFSALDDSNGEYMEGTPAVIDPPAAATGWVATASAHPLGYLYAPAPATGSTVVA